MPTDGFYDPVTEFEEARLSVKKMLEKPSTPYSDEEIKAQSGVSTVPRSCCIECEPDDEETLP